jgi:hypothetical protein
MLKRKQLRMFNQNKTQMNKKSTKNIQNQDLDSIRYISIKDRKNIKRKIENIEAEVILQIVESRKVKNINIVSIVILLMKVIRAYRDLNVDKNIESVLEIESIKKVINKDTIVIVYRLTRNTVENNKNKRLLQNKFLKCHNKFLFKKYRHLLLLDKGVVVNGRDLHDHIIDKIKIKVMMHYFGLLMDGFQN